MPPESPKAELTRRWLAKAERDLRVAARAATPPPLRDAVAFHGQQAVEKSLKAFLTWHDRTFRKTHNLVELGHQCGEVDASLKPLLQRAARLTEYAWKFRYPGEPEEPSLEEAEEALAIARQVYEAVLARLPEETRP